MKEILHMLWNATPAQIFIIYFCVVIVVVIITLSIYLLMRVMSDRRYKRHVSDMQSQQRARFEKSKKIK